MKTKRYDGYRSFQYLEAGVDYTEFQLARQTGRVPQYESSATAEHMDRAEALMTSNLIVSVHDHTSIAPENPSERIAMRREGRDFTGYAGLANSGVDVFFENFMDGNALITSKHGWKWDDVLFDLGMRFSDIAHQSMVYVATTLEDVVNSGTTDRIAFIACVEAATPIENEVDRVDVLYGFGIRCMGITYSETNALGSGLGEQEDGGLTELGRRVVRRMGRIGMTIDLAHAGDRTSLDVIDLSEKPVLITHGGARVLWPRGRMKPDVVLRSLAEKGGVIGIMAAPHTTITRRHSRHSLESVMEHVEYCVERFGVEHVALGPDTLFGDHVAHQKVFGSYLSRPAPDDLGYEAVEYVAGMENPGEAIRNAVTWMVQHGYSDKDIGKMAGQNVMRVLRETWVI